MSVPKQYTAIFDGKTYNGIVNRIIHVRNNAAVAEAEVAEVAEVAPENAQKKEPLSIPNSTFWQKQEGAGCGRFALNHLFGGEYFVKDGSEITDDNIKTLRPQIALQPLCRYLSETKLFSEADGSPLQCPSSENYDFIVLQAALGILGYSATQVNVAWLESTTEPDFNNAAFVGYIVNYGGGHWVAYRKVDETHYKYIDSFSKHEVSHGEVLSIADLKTQDKGKYFRQQDTIGVYKIVFNGSFISVVDMVTHDKVQVKCDYKENDTVMYHGHACTVLDRTLDEKGECVTVSIFDTVDSKEIKDVKITEITKIQPEQGGKYSKMRKSRKSRNKKA